MFNKSRLKDVLVQYKKDFIPIHWEEEKYKWEAVKCFQDHWDVNAIDFADMLERSLLKTMNLLASANNFPAKEIKGFARTAPEEVRSMFLGLFDEEKDIYGRIAAFKEQSFALLEKYNNGVGQHYQYENAITTYLWLRYPDKYYIYKFSEIKAVAEELESDYSFKKGAYADNIHNFYKFYDEICGELHRDTELVGLLKSQLTDSCYPDLQLRTLTFDVGFYISRLYSQDGKMAGSETGWFPADYNPGFSVEDWIALLGDKEVFTQDSLAIMKRMKDNGGDATCIELSEKYGGAYNFYNIGSSSLAKRIVKLTNCPVPQNDTENSKWWPVLYVGRYTSKGERGVYRWKLRSELSEALDRFDLSEVKLYVRADHPKEASESYTKDDFLNEVYMPEQRYNTLVSVLRHKKNIILQGAPGVGKTFTAKRLAYSVIGKKDDECIEFVQFHQNYSYEDFMMGYKPTKDGFEMKYGVFYRFCQKAINHPDKDYFFIIDEINRGNLSKIFGELLMLMERDYRDVRITLAYHEESFCIPRNLYIIGMMNTADRSLAMIDYALRRRFSFFDMEPGFDSEGFIRYQKERDSETFNELISKIKDLNMEIARDKSLGKGFCIGHSYFCKEDACTDERLREIVDYDILPMLSEYWFDDMDTLRRWENNLYGVFQ